jgi:hypothetical protein
MAAPVEIFISYAQADEKLRRQLDNHLVGLRRRGLVSTWYDHLILPGSIWSGEIATHIKAAVQNNFAKMRMFLIMSLWQIPR